MKTYIDIYLNSEGGSVRDLTTAMSKIGLMPLRGPHDFVIEWENEEELLSMLDKLHNALKGLKIMYTVKTEMEDMKETVWLAAVG